MVLFTSAFPAPGPASDLLTAHSSACKKMDQGREGETEAGTERTGRSAGRRVRQDMEVREQGSFPFFTPSFISPCLH